MKIALIGVGKCSEYWIDAAAFCGIEITAICDNLQKNLDSSPIIQKFNSVEDLISAKLKFDVAAVLTPPSTHFEILVNLAKNGIAAIVEKPISNSLMQIETLYNEYNNKAFITCAYHSANALDIKYFMKNRPFLEKGMGNLIRFDCYFYDPYVVDNKLSEKAINLGGSYVDSCVNALSVVEKLIGLDNLKSLNFSKKLLDYNNYQSEINFTNGKVFGTIRTNWLVNENYKCTVITYEQGKIILHHSEQKVIINRNSEQENTMDCSQNRPRLLNHYIGVLKDLETKYKNKETNLRESLDLHSILLSGKQYFNFH